LNGKQTFQVEPCSRT